MPEIKWWREDRVGTPSESSHIATVFLKWTLLFQLCSAKNLKCEMKAKMETAEEDGHEVDARVECKAEGKSTAVTQ